MSVKLLNFLIDKMQLIGLVVSIGLLIYGRVTKTKWHYYPLYLVLIIYCILIILNYFEAFNPSLINSPWILRIGAFLIVISITMLFVFPTEELPTPTGQFEIGTKTYDLEDKTRRELYSEHDDRDRKIKYQIWYPTDITKGYKKAKWISEGRLLTRQLARSMHLPFFMLDHTADIDSNSFHNAPVSDLLKDYPVVIISHGWKGFRELHTDFAEELTSHGFIVVSIDHTFGTQAVKFDDGSIAYLNKKALPRMAKQEKFTDSANSLVKTFGDDIGSVLDELKDNEIYDKMDIESMGVLGHSTGGGGDVYKVLEDRRIKAVMGLDAWVEPIECNKLKHGISIPSLFLRSEQWNKGPNNSALNLLLDNSSNATLIQMDQTTHVDFAMTYMYSPVSKYVGFTGKCGGRYSSDIQRELILNFFDENLRTHDKENKHNINGIVDKYDHMKIIDKE